MNVKLRMADVENSVTMWLAPMSAAVTSPVRKAIFVLEKVKSVSGVSKHTSHHDPNSLLFTLCLLSAIRKSMLILVSQSDCFSPLVRVISVIIHEPAVYLCN